MKAPSFNDGKKIQAGQGAGKRWLKNRPEIGNLTRAVTSHLMFRLVYRTTRRLSSGLFKTVLPP